LFVPVTDKFDEWRRKHNGIVLSLQDQLNGNGIKKIHLDAVDNQTFFTLPCPVNPNSSIVTWNGHVLDNTDYFLSTTTFTILPPFYAREVDDINIYDYNVQGGISRQYINGTIGQTVFPLSPLVNPDHTIVTYDGHVLDNTDYALTTDTLTLLTLESEPDSDINLIDYSNGFIDGYKLLVQDNGTVLTSRDNINIVGAKAEDDAANNRVNVNINKWDLVAVDSSVDPFSQSLVDVSSNAVTLTLPATPNDGEVIEIAQIDGDATANNIVLDGGTKNIRQYVSVNASVARQSYDATAGQTVFPLSPDMTVSNTSVYRNGHLLDGTDYTLTSSSLTLIDPADLDDDITLLDIGGGSINTTSTTLTIASNFSGRKSFIYNASKDIWTEI
jgi:hypothetical protein